LPNLKEEIRDLFGIWVQQARRHDGAVPKMRLPDEGL